jgi:hypothetical protein
MPARELAIEHNESAQRSLNRPSDNRLGEVSGRVCARDGSCTEHHG